MASGNAGKLAEIAKLLEPLNIEVIAQKDLGVSDAIEDGLTFAENSYIKATHASVATGLPAIADDSGLAVAALAGAPGVYSARYAGESASDEQNIQKLLKEMANIDTRDAAFHCVATFVTPETKSADDAVVGCGVWNGTILKTPQGRFGFGYDPVFFDNELLRSAAELSPTEKNARSHRGAALTELTQKLRPLFE